MTLNSNLITLNLYFDQGADVAAGKLSGHVVVRDDHKDGSYTATVIRPSPGSWLRLGIGLVPRVLVCVFTENSVMVALMLREPRRAAVPVCSVHNPRTSGQHGAMSI